MYTITQKRFIIFVAICIAFLVAFSTTYFAMDFVDSDETSMNVALFQATWLPMFIVGTGTHFFLKMFSAKKILELQNNNTRFETLFENSVDGILIIHNQKFVDCNQKIVDMLRCDSKNAVYNTHPSKLSPEIQPDGRPSFEKAGEMMNLAFENKGHQFEWMHTRSDGEDFWVEVTLVPINHDGDDLTQCVWREISDRKNMEIELSDSRIILEHKANFDQLTNIPNRSLFDDRLEQILSHSYRNHQKFALLFIDVDDFKDINDTYGHDVGDEYLIELTKRISKHVRESDTFARIGGDEFAIIMNNINDSESILRLVQGIFNELDEKVIIGEHILQISTSIGISVYPDDARDIESMLKYADLAMYHVKSSGRNNFAFYDQEMNKQALETLAIKKDLIKAIEREEFFVYYQPQIDASTNVILGMEALVRWQHHEKGLVFPDYFIPIAESTGLIVALDRCVMKIAMQQFALWYEQGYKPGKLSLNLAMKQIESDDCLIEMQEMIQASKCLPEWLELEITESDLMTNPKKAINTLNKIRDLGIKLSIDDFGTGYSSLTYLKEFPISKLKIDQSFVRDLDDTKGDKVIINSIIALAKALNLEVIAEGVETEKQKNILLQSDCQQMQGYLFSKPVAAEKLELILRDGLEN